MADFKINGVTFASESGGTVSLSNANIFPTGHVLQTVNYTETTSFEQTLDNNLETLTNGTTNFGVNITPKVTGSKTLIMVTIGFMQAHNNGGTGYAVGARLRRDSTDIKISTGNSSYPHMTMRLESFNPEYARSSTYTILDETPNTKDVQVAYTLAVQRHVASSTYTIALNEANTTQSGASEMNAYQSSTTSHFIAQEIAP